MARATAELVVLILTITVAIVIVSTTVALIVTDARGSTVRQAAETIGAVVPVMLGVVAGYMLRDRTR